MIGANLIRTMRLKTLSRGAPRWVPLAGNWSIDGLSGPATSKSSGSAIENIAVLGGDCEVEGLSAKFTILEASASPPTGGAIFYLEMTAPDSFLSYHFCPAKALVECFARRGNDWRRMSMPVPFQIEVGQEHRVDFQLETDIWRLSIDGRAVQSIRSLGGGGRLGLGAKLCPVRFSDLSTRIHAAVA